MKKEKYPNLLLAATVHEHPLLIRGLGLVPAAMAAYSLKNAVAITLLLCFPLLAVCALSAVLGRRLPRLLFPPTMVVFSCLTLVPVIFVADSWFPGRMAELGAYVPLLAVSSVILTLSRSASEKPLGDAMISTAGGLAGWGVVVCLLGALRELLGYNTIWDRPVSMPLQLDSMEQPFTALILLAFAGALFEFIRVRYAATDAKQEPQTAGHEEGEA